MESSFESQVSSENLHREMQLRRENESSLEIPNVGQDSSEKVTKVSRFNDVNTLPATLEGKLFPNKVKIGKQPLTASIAVVWAL